VPGELDWQYVRARRVLLDALEALGDQRRAIVLVGAQAVYLRTGEADFSVSPFTTDADLAVAPELLLQAPVLTEAMKSGGFTSAEQGIWKNQDGVQVDLLVPRSVAGKIGRRSAQLPPPHGKEVARWVQGLEPALVDRSLEPIGALEQTDPRRCDINVAGPAALLVAKLHKIAERVAAGDAARINDKDALDVLRVLRATETAALAATITTLTRSPLAGAAVLRSLDLLRDLFAAEDAAGSQMAVRATAPLENPATIDNCHSEVLQSKHLREALTYLAWVNISLSRPPRCTILHWTPRKPLLYHLQG